MSAQSPRESRKRSLPPDQRSPGRTDGSRYSSRAGRDDEETPWWEQARGGDQRDSRGSHGAAGGRRYDDRDARGPERSRYDERRYDDRRSSSGRGGRGGYEQQQQRGSYSGGAGYGGGRGGHRNDYYDHRAAGPRHGYGAEPEDPDYLNYSDQPAPRHPSKGIDRSPARDHRQRSTSAALSTTSASAAPSTAKPAPVDASGTEPGEVVEDKKTADEGPELELELPVPVDPEAIIAERRRKRAEILAKYASASSAAPSTAAGSEASTRVGTPALAAEPEAAATPGREEVERVTKRLKLGTESPRDDTPSGAAGAADSTTDDFDLFKSADANEAIRIGEQDASTHLPGEEEVSAADYNPDEDRKRDDQRHAQRELEAAAGKGQMDKKEKREVMVVDDDDDDDMFSVGHKITIEDNDDGEGRGFVPVINRADATTGLVDNFDDAEGYYKLLLGELLDNGRYHVVANLGKGMFSGVVRARDTETKNEKGEQIEVAIKVIRSQESMYKAGLKEANILRKLQEADPDDKKHVVRLLRTFEHRGHLCLVFESLSMNLREVVKRFGKDVGINLRAVRAYASQMFLALALLKKCDIMHADIKPDNILVNESKSTLKVCDLGSASDVSENDITPYLVSRFYRAPEIILGLPYDCSLDTWSIGCTLYELYTGKILFPGRTNNHMLFLIMELKGKFNHKQLKKAKFTENHFDERLEFLSVEKTGDIKTLSIPSKASHDLRSRLMPATAMKKLKEDEVRLLGHFVDLLDRMLSLEPSKRPTPKEMLSHPFLR